MHGNGLADADTQRSHARQERGRIRGRPTLWRAWLRRSARSGSVAGDSGADQVRAGSEQRELSAVEAGAGYVVRVVVLAVGGSDRLADARGLSGLGAAVVGKHSAEAERAVADQRASRLRDRR